MEVIAKLKNYRQPARKVRLVADLIKGLDVKTALDQLKFLNKRVAVPMSKLIQSAAANGKNNFSLNPLNLYIKTIAANDGPILKRWRARAFGRASAIQKRTSHIIIVLDEKTPTSKIVSKSKKGAVQKVSEKEEVKTVKNIEEVKKLDSGSAESLREGSEKGQTKVKIAEKVKQKGFMPKIFSRKTG